jgi:uncharacterized membrane protein YqjE
MSQENNPLTDRLKTLQQDVRQLVEKKIELFLIEIGERFSSFVGKSTSKLITIVFMFLATIFLLIALGFFLGTLLDSNALGFTLVATLLFVVALAVYVLGPSLIGANVSKSITEQLLEEKADKNETSSGNGVSKNN